MSKKLVQELRTLLGVESDREILESVRELLAKEHALEEIQVQLDKFSPPEEGEEP